MLLDGLCVALEDFVYFFVLLDEYEQQVVSSLSHLGLYNSKEYIFVWEQIDQSQKVVVGDRYVLIVVGGDFG